MTPAAPAPTTAATLSTVSAWAQADELAQDAGPQRLSTWFGVTGLLLLATLLAAVFVQARQYTLLNTTVRVQDDYLVLGLYQVETEYLRLREQLRKEVDAPGSSALQLRYDIFISRISMLGSERARRLIGGFNSEARPQSDAPGVLQALDSFTRRADLYLGSETRAKLSPQAAKVLLADLETLDAPIHDVLQNASHRVAAQVTERQAKVRNHNQIGLALTGFLLAMVAVFASIALRQMRKLEHRRSRLEALADQLRDARIEAEAASDLKSEFLADMSHELRTPLHGLLGMLTLLRESPRDTHAAAWLLTADESAQHLRRLLDDILDLSKLNSGSLTLLPTPVDLLALLRETRSLLLPAASAKGLSLRIEIDPTLEVRADLAAVPWRERSERLWPFARDALQALMHENDVVVLEGAGSPAEINLHASDYVNMRSALEARAACLLVTDIDRGGAFAHLYGTHRLLPPEERALIRGFVLNRFRGDASLLPPGPQQLQELTGVPTVAVLPMWREHGLPEEDGVFDDTPIGTAERVPGSVTVAVIAYPQVSNLDEFQPLRMARGVRLRWARTPAAIAGADWVVLPGSKHTSSDLAWLRAQGLAAAIARHAAAGKRVLGVCGGLQMLGTEMLDPHGVDGDAQGLGLLPLRTRFDAPKLLRHTQARFGTLQGDWGALSEIEFSGYEIRHGRTEAQPGTAVALRNEAGEPIGWQQGAVLGLYAHGLFESPAAMQALFGADLRSLDQVFDGLADFVDHHFEPGTLLRLLQPP